MAICMLCNKKMKFTDSGFTPQALGLTMCSDCHEKWTKCQEGITERVFSEDNQSIIGYMRDQGIVISEENEPSFQDYLNTVRERVNQDRDKYEKQLAEKRQKEQEEEMKRKAAEVLVSDIANIKLTTGYSFEGYRITDYLGVLSGECVMGTGFLSETFAGFADVFGSVSVSFSEKCNEAKNYALTELKKICVVHGANAIIGIDFDYLTFNNNMIGVIANGTAVRIER